MNRLKPIPQINTQPFKYVAGLAGGSIHQVLYYVCRLDTLGHKKNCSRLAGPQKLKPSQEDTQALLITRRCPQPSSHPTEQEERAIAETNRATGHDAAFSI